MQDFGLPKGSWRKSSQWKSLTRKHAGVLCCAVLCHAGLSDAWVVLPAGLPTQEECLAAKFQGCGHSARVGLWRGFHCTLC